MRLLARFFSSQDFGERTPETHITMVEFKRMDKQSKATRMYFRP